MKLITVEVEMAPADLTGAVAAIEAKAGAVRAMAGCDHYALTTGAGRLTLVQRWQSDEDFAAYRGSAAFQELIGALKPVMTAPPVTTLATIDSPP